MDQSALGFDHQEKLSQHASQKGSDSWQTCNCGHPHKSVLPVKFEIPLNQSSSDFSFCPPCVCVPNTLQFKFFIQWMYKEKHGFCCVWWPQILVLMLTGWFII